MKFLLITSVVEFEKDIYKLFKNSEIEVFSTHNIQGHKLQKPKNLQDNWFSDHRDTYNSKLFFTFTSETQIDKMLSEIKKFNRENKSNNPVKAIVSDIEKFV